MRQLHIRLNDEQILQLERLMAMEPGITGYADAVRYAIGAIAKQNITREASGARLEKIIEIQTEMLACGLDRILLNQGDNQREFIIPGEETVLYKNAREHVEARIQKRTTHKSKDRLQGR